MQFQQFAGGVLKSVETGQLYYPEKGEEVAKVPTDPKADAAPAGDKGADSNTSAPAGSADSNTASSTDGKGDGTDTSKTSATKQATAAPAATTATSTATA